MTTLLDKDTKIILKLDLGEGGLRRIPLSKLWDDASCTVSYSQLANLALQYNEISLKAVPRENVKLTTTYVDEDGDEITISSDEELADAFGQFVDSVPPVVRAKATVVKSSPIREAVEEGKRLVDHLERQQRHAQPYSQKYKPHSNRQQREQAKILAEKAAAVRARQRERAREQNDLDLFETFVPSASTTASSTAAAAAPTPVIQLPPVNVPPVSAPRKVNASNGNDSNHNRSKSQNPRNVRSDTSNLDPNFIHGRHTCDGCLSTPIYGIRYHAINMPDYDLCSNCHSNYRGSDIVFKPMQLDRDRHLQNRWQRRQLLKRNVQCGLNGNSSKSAGSNRPIPISVADGAKRLQALQARTLTRSMSETQARRYKACDTSKKVIDTMDEALKEAVRRSMEDLKTEVKKEKKESDAPGEVKVVEAEVVSTSSTSEHKKEENEKEKVEKDVPVAATIDITAGNDHTQLALDNMDPALKEKISLSLNDFFARRQSQNQSQSNVSTETAISPDEQTQQKIDAMDDKLKEAIRRSLNEFFTNRRTAREGQNQTGAEAGAAVDPPASEDVDVASEGISLSVGDITSSHGVPSVVLDIVVDGDDVDDDLSEGTDGTDGVDTNSNISEEESKDSSGTASTKSKGSSKEGWQMVAEDDEMIAVAAQMLGSALFHSDSNIDHSSA